ncbi:Asparagine--tRNA ligase, chloroplastic/mitochondrial [Vitis vinifera]|uniref:Asparagine--tRNA ligase, chloroplastic/mitochondrial n=1 Tax=Vitis vinifera TaxID=29760 RepID=A0A438ESG0_VITVI|nr:Asparagine--tRNA ligase, chloroplastic/mitochondrial [Vitis vinifera]
MLYEAESSITKMQHVINECGHDEDVQKDGCSKMGKKGRYVFGEELEKTHLMVARVRNALAYATHKFFQENGFVWISSPIITASDCEGAGEQFCVTTLIPSSREATDSTVDAIPKAKDGLIDWSQDFFGKPAFLTVSGQLNAETYATALSDMIEPELAFADLNDDMACATAYLQYVVTYILENCKEDMEFFNTWIEKGIINRLSV